MRIDNAWQDEVPSRIMNLRCDWQLVILRDYRDLLANYRHAPPFLMTMSASMGSSRDYSSDLIIFLDSLNVCLGTICALRRHEQKQKTSSLLPVRVAARARPEQFFRFAFLPLRLLPPLHPELVRMGLEPLSNREGLITDR